MRAINRLLVVSVLVLVLVFPWRLMTLVTEALVVQPGRTHVTTSNARYWEAQTLEDKLEGWGWEVLYSDLAKSGLYGLTTYAKRTIEVDQGLHWDDRYRVLLHEAAHAFAPMYIHVNDVYVNEMFAESVAAIACNCGLREHARYLASARLHLPIVMLYQADIYRVAAFLR